MKLCVTCGVNPRRKERRECNTCISRRQRGTKKPGQFDHLKSNGDLFRDELIDALRKVENLPSISDGMST